VATPTSKNDSLGAAPHVRLSAFAPRTGIRDATVKVDIPAIGRTGSLAFHGADGAPSPYSRDELRKTVTALGRAVHYDRLSRRSK